MKANKKNYSDYDFSAFVVCSRRDVGFGLKFDRWDGGMECCYVTRGELVRHEYDPCSEGVGEQDS